MMARNIREGFVLGTVLILVVSIFLPLFTSQAGSVEREGMAEFSEPDPDDLADSPWPKFRGGGKNRGRSIYNTSLIDGTEKWRFDTGRDILSSPTIGPNGTIYVGSYDNHTYALNPDGTEKWSVELGGQVFSSPTVDSNGTIYVGCTDDHVYALNPDGGEKWRFETGGNVLSSPAIGPDGTIYVGSKDNHLYALNPNGTERWAFGTYSEVWSSPAIGSNGTIYFGSHDNKTYALYPNGTEKWRSETDGNVLSSPALGSDGTIYVGSEDNHTYALNPDGTQRWRFETGDIVDSSPAIGPDGTIYVGSFDGRVYALDADGTEKWSFETGESVMSSPAVGSDGTIYVGSHDRYLHALNPNGTRKWRFETGNNVFSSPAIGEDGTIYVGSNDGNLYAIGYSYFEIDDISAPDVVEGEMLEVNVTVRNTGDTQSSQYIEMTTQPDIGGEGKMISLASGESTTETFSTPTSRGDSGHYNLTVSSEDDERQEDFLVKEPAHFEVEILDCVREVAMGEELTVEYSVSNNGEAVETQTIELNVEGETEDSEEVTLGEGEAHEGELIWRTQEEDLGENELKIVSDHTFERTPVKVVEPPYFQVDIIDYEEKIVEGEELSVEYAITNSGGAEETQDILVTIGDEEFLAEEQLTLRSDEEYNGEFTEQTGEGDAGVYDIAVESEDDEEVIEDAVVVLEPTFFEVDFVVHEDEVKEGGEVTVEYTVVNNGEVEGIQDIVIIIGEDESVIEERVRLGPEETFSRAVTWHTEEGDAGVYDITVRSEDDEQLVEKAVTVLSPAFFEVDFAVEEEEVKQGESLTVKYNVTNTGGVEGNQDILLLVSGEKVDEQNNLTLEPGETFTGDFTWTSKEGDEGTYNITVESEDDKEVEEDVVTVLKEETFPWWGWALLAVLIAEIIIFSVIKVKNW